MSATTSGGAADKKRAWVSKFLFLEEHLAQRTPQAREAMAAKTLAMGEDIANANKPANAKAHAVSGHGPGTDQTPRLVSGRRADQVVREQADGTEPTEKVTLTRPTSTRDMPKWDTVGDDPSNVSSRFGSATAMLAAVEDAFAQATLLQSRIAKEMKEAADDRQVLEVPAVADALAALVDLRKRLDAANASLQALQKGGDADALPAALETVAKLRAELEGASGAFIAEKNKAMAARTLPPAPKLGDQRFVRTVAPGEAVGESFAVDGPALTSDAALTETEMQDRFATIRRTRDIKQATVVLDPATVTGADGTTRRAGWQVQTAFPSGDGTPTRDLSELEYKLLRADEPVTEADKREKQAHKTFEEAVSRKNACNATLDGLRTQRKAAETEEGAIDPDYYPALWEEAPDLGFASAEAQAARHVDLKEQIKLLKGRIATADLAVKAAIQDEKKAGTAWKKAEGVLNATKKAAEAKKLQIQAEAAAQQ